MKDNTVIVLDLSNYKEEYREKVPFKATVAEKDDSTIWVISQATSKQYEIYPHQVLECLSIEDIKQLLVME